ncbi:MAG: ABC-F family ATP-binding cassette domain-containing protein [Myxococcota bacterium]
MTATLHARDITLSLGGTEVLCGVSLSLFPGKRVGVIGPNGVGKSTLLRVLAGEIPPDGGSLTLAPPQATIGYLPQEPDRRPGETVLEFLARRTGVAEATARLEATTQALAEQEPGSDDAYAEALERWMDLGGGDLEVRAEAMLEELGIGAGLVDRPTSALSGGQAARVSLAAVLLSRFDILLLDEPTNDLDFDGLERLEAFATSTDAALAIVSHDRAFLERVITDVVELDEHSRTATSFGGGWGAFLETRAVARRHAEDDYATYSEKRDALQARAQKQRLWSMQGVRKAKRDPNEKDKHIKNFRVATSEKVASKAKATERAMERLEKVDKPWQSWELRLEIAETSRSGDVVSRLTGAVARRGSFVLGPVDLQVRFAERIAIVGANGSGKSTLIEMLLGRLEPWEGTHWMGPGVVVGELEQRRSRFFGEEPLLDVFVDESGLLPVDARTLLAKFGLMAEHVARTASSLSPGERTRASLALFQARGVNCLVLDEPTNHLDMPAIEQLESALESFAGTVLLVTHDRVLLERFGADRVLELGSGRVAG